MKKRRMKWLAALLAAVGLAVLIVGAFIRSSYRYDEDGNLIPRRSMSSREVCLSHHKVLQAAVEVWQMEHHGKQPTKIEDLFGSNSFIKTALKCPKGGAYYLAPEDGTNLVPCCHFEPHEEYWRKHCGQ